MDGGIGVDRPTWDQWAARARDAAGRGRTMELRTRWVVGGLLVVGLAGLALRGTPDARWLGAIAVWGAFLTWVLGWLVGRGTERRDTGQVVTEVRQRLGPMLAGATRYDVARLVTARGTTIGGDVVIAEVEAKGVLVTRRLIPPEWMTLGDPAPMSGI